MRRGNSLTKGKEHLSFSVIAFYGSKGKNCWQIIRVILYCYFLKSFFSPAKSARTCTFFIVRELTILFLVCKVPLLRHGSYDWRLASLILECCLKRSQSLSKYHDFSVSDSLRSVPDFQELIFCLCFHLALLSRFICFQYLHTPSLLNYITCQKYFDDKQFFFTRVKARGINKGRRRILISLTT